MCGGRGKFREGVQPFTGIKLMPDHIHSGKIQRTERAQNIAESAGIVAMPLIFSAEVSAGEQVVFFAPLLNNVQIAFNE